MDRLEIGLSFAKSVVPSRFLLPMKADRFPHRRTIMSRTSAFCAAAIMRFGFLRRHYPKFWRFRSAFYPPGSHPWFSPHRVFGTRRNLALPLRTHDLMRMVTESDAA